MLTPVRADDSAPLTGTVVQRGDANWHPVIRHRPRTISGWEVFRLTRAVLAKYAWWPSDEALDTAAVWVIAQAVRDDGGMPVWFTAPRMLFSSAEPKSGKSTVMTLMAWACGTSISEDNTLRAVTDTFGVYKEALFIDEVQAIFGVTGVASGRMRAKLNASYARGAVSRRTSGSKRVETEAFGWACLAGREDVLTHQAENLSDLLQRCIKIIMVRPEEKMPPASLRAMRDCQALSLVIGQWAATVAHDAPDVEMDLEDEWLASPHPQDQDGRIAQLWRPLLGAARLADAEAKRDAIRQRRERLWRPVEEQRVVKAMDTLGAASSAADKAAADLMASYGG